MRIAPDQDDREAFERLRDHLLEHAPWGARVEVVLDEHGLGFAADARGPLYDEARAAFEDAWGVAPVDIGVGGSIPFVAAFAQSDAGDVSPSEVVVGEPKNTVVRPCDDSPDPDCDDLGNAVVHGTWQYERALRSG